MAFLLLALITPLVASLLVWLLPASSPSNNVQGLKQPHRSHEDHFIWIGRVAMSISFLCMFVLWIKMRLLSDVYQFAFSFRWFQFSLGFHQHWTLRIAYGLDGLSLPLFSLAVLLGWIIFFAVRPPGEQIRAYTGWMLLALFAVMSSFAAIDLLTFILSMELTLLAVFFLILRQGKEQHWDAALQFLLYRGLASVFIILALLGLAAAASRGGLWPASYAVLSAVLFHHSVPHIVFLALFIGVLLEEAFVPLHSWFPNAMQDAGAGVAVLLAGILTKTGLYALIRFGVGMMPQDANDYRLLIATVGIINLLYAAFAAWSAKDWRRLISFSSISHMGLALFAVATLRQTGMLGALFLLVSSGLVSALFLLTSEGMFKRLHSLEFSRLGGLSKSMPIASGFLLFAALGSLGLPLTSSFVGEFQSIFSGFAVLPGFAFVALLGLLLSAIYSLNAIRKTTFGPVLDSTLMQLADLRWLESWPLAVLSLFLLLLGILPNPFAQVALSAFHHLRALGG